MVFPVDNIQVIIAASHFLTRLGIKTLISVIGVQAELNELDSLEDVEMIIAPGARSFLIVEQKLCGMNGALTLEKISQRCPRCRILLIGDVVLKNCPCSQCVLDSDSQQEILDKFQSFFAEEESPYQKTNGQNMLSDRETEVLKEVARGFANKEIADKLHISINTVITHRKNITEKLGVKTVSALTVYALINNLITPEEAIN